MQHPRKTLNFKRNTRIRHCCSGDRKERACSQGNDAPRYILHVIFHKMMDILRRTIEDEICSLQLQFPNEITSSKLLPQDPIFCRQIVQCGQQQNHHHRIKCVSWICIIGSSHNPYKLGQMCHWQRWVLVRALTSILSTLGLAGNCLWIHFDNSLFHMLQISLRTAHSYFVITITLMW